MESILVGRGSNHFSDWKNPNVLLITPTPGSGVVLHLWISYHTNVVAATRINHHYHQPATISHRLIFWCICHCLSIDLSINTIRSLNFLAKYVNGAPMFFFSRDSLGQDWTSMGILAEKRLFSPQMLGTTWPLPPPFGYLTINSADLAQAVSSIVQKWRRWDAFETCSKPEFLCNTTGWVG